MPALLFEHKMVYKIVLKTEMKFILENPHRVEIPIMHLHGAYCSRNAPN
ncbi:MAG: hypothetical protein RLZZ612_414 [Pseudomonadota bacterium]|jgi:hypothetical protein